MKRFLFSSIVFGTSIVLATAQTAPKPAAPAKTASTGTASAAGGVKLPPGVPRVRGILKTAFALRYQDIKLGTGADAEPNKLYKVLYTGYLAADGHKFDSSDDHRQPLRDKDGKPVLGDDGKPKLGDAQPISFPQGFGRVIPGFDQGFAGMKVGGKRRLFIPWQLAYGAHGRPGPDAAHPGIPAKADLIFDIELVDVAEMQMPPSRPMPHPMPPTTPLPGRPFVPPAGSAPGAPGGEAKPATPSAPGTTTAPAQPPPSAPATTAPGTTAPGQPGTQPAPPPSGSQPQSQPQQK
jgi:peptidylprolyl isomerase